MVGHTDNPAPWNMREKYEMLRQEFKHAGINFHIEAWDGTGYHGTSNVNATQISTSGFDWTRNNSRSWYGPGVYFFVDDHRTGSGHQAAYCFACHFQGGYVDPAVVNSQLSFSSLMNLADEDKAKTFWQVKAHLKAQSSSGVPVTEISVANLFGMHIAPAFDCDGIKAKFPIQEPKSANPEKRTHPGVCTRKPAAVKTCNVMRPSAYSSPNSFTP